MAELLCLVCLNVYRLLCSTNEIARTTARKGVERVGRGTMT